MSETSGVTSGFISLIGLSGSGNPPNKASARESASGGMTLVKSW